MYKILVISALLVASFGVPSISIAIPTVNVGANAGASGSIGGALGNIGGSISGGLTGAAITSLLTQADTALTTALNVLGSIEGDLAQGSNAAIAAKLALVNSNYYLNQI